MLDLIQAESLAGNRDERLPKNIRTLPALLTEQQKVSVVDINPKSFAGIISRQMLLQLWYRQAHEMSFYRAAGLAFS